MPDDLTALRDRLAVLCGFEYRRCVCALCQNLSDEEASGWVSHNPPRAGLSPSHPFPPGDLTALAAAWPEGKRMLVSNHLPLGWAWEAMWLADDCKSVKMDEVGNTEYEARLRLTVAVREAMASDPP